MTVLPVVQRELVVAARRAVTYWTRFFAAAGALAAFILLWMNYHGSLATMGHTLFNTLGMPTLAFCLLSGVFITADSLSVEKREGTLGLLFLTDLKGYDIVLGKLAASSIHAFFGLLAIFPILALPLLTGGVSGGEFWRTMLVFVCALYFSLSAGMLVSAANQDGRQAMTAAFGIMVVVGGLLPLLWDLQSHSLHIFYWLNFILLLPSPSFAYNAGFDAQYFTRFGPAEYWHSILVILSLATGCIVAASVVLPRTWRRTAPREPARKRGGIPFFRPAPKKRRPALADGNPYYWLSMSDRGGQNALDRVVMVVFLIWLACVTLWSGNRTGVIYPITVFYVFGMHLVAKVVMASESGRRFNQDMQSGAMELLIVTPLPVQDIISGQRKALQTQFRRSLLALTLVNLVTWQLIFFFDLNARHDTEAETVFTEIFLGGAVLLWLDSWALGWVGMWRGIKSRKHPRAVLATLGRVTGLPWLAFFLFIFIATTNSRMGNEFMDAAIVVWLLAGAVIDGVCIAGASFNLNTNFRATVAQRYDG